MRNIKALIKTGCDLFKITKNMQRKFENKFKESGGLKVKRIGTRKLSQALTNSLSVF